MNSRSAPPSSRFAKPTSRRPITHHEKQLWSEMAQVLMLAGLSESSHWEAKQIIFHGGTSLHLGWASPRWSEDLDFLLADHMLTQMSVTMKDVVTRMERYMLRLDAGLRVELKDKSTSKMGRFSISISKEGVLGKSVVKSEFWGVTDKYLDMYQATPKTPILPEAMTADSMIVRLRAKLPVATLSSVFVDKLVAMAGRPYTKYRDVFDLWWISRSRDFNHPEADELVERVNAHSSAYRIDPNLEEHPEVQAAAPFATSLSHRLRAYAARLEEPGTIGDAHQDLKRFLLDHTGSLRFDFDQETVQSMIDHAIGTARQVANLLDGQAQFELDPPMSYRHRHSG